ncbi:hypothetical protein MNBD_GAMMA08-22 [hydrothermal vent metagenome]|uniref:Type II secretion system protein GspB C-terminal domain-containing protein n=1 Tax=hydrothermal vent metagenome TaxID=652676 RepID=A0A3B0XJ78_9ZZZZ
MSYILDALKKSDRERKRGGVPDLQTVHIPISTESQTPLILYGFISVLLLVLAFVIGMVISDHESQEEQIESVVELDEKISTQQTTKAKKSARVKTEIENSVVDVGVVSEIKKVESSRPKEKNIVVHNVQAEPKKPVVKAVPVQSMMQNRNINEIPYLNELPDYQQSSVPEMTFAGHVYSTMPSNRSVIINNYAMSEGDTVVQGIKIVEITSSGVVFSLHEQLFRMDILQDWSFE